MWDGLDVGLGCCCCYEEVVDGSKIGCLGDMVWVFLEEWRLDVEFIDGRGIGIWCLVYCCVDGGVYVWLVVELVCK